jgi:hypothetical protein
MSPGVVEGREVLQEPQTVGFSQETLVNFQERLGELLWKKPV